MIKLKLVLIGCLFLFGNKIHAQFLWYENETETENVLSLNNTNGVFTKNEANPDVNGINTNTISSKFVRNANVTKGFSYFELPQNIITDEEYIISLKAYIDIPSANLSPVNRIRVYLKNTTTNDFKQLALNFTVGQEWQTFSFVFNQGDLPAGGFEYGGYDQMYIGYGNGQGSTSPITYYIDQIYGTKEQEQLVKVLQGSWGGRFYVRGGSTLDTFVSNGYDYIIGAQEIASSYPTMGHVMTNATNNAKSHLWTLRTNPNVDDVMGVANSIIDEEFVPSLANEQVIIDVISILKNANKKVILYLNSMSPGERATETGAAAWNNYVNTFFSGDGHAAWMNFCEGYIKRFTELGIDGYWMDAFNRYNANSSLGDAEVESTTAEKAEFIQMIRATAPNATITANINADYFVDEQGDFLLVDTDGIVDLDNTDYKIIKMSATNQWSDFTAGHITPLAQGAPPNSWAYEEFTVTDIEESPISNYQGVKQTLKHLFLPIRSTWSGVNSDLMFDGEQAYRFVKRITDAGGSVTFSNTTAIDGTTASDEVAVLTFVDQQFAINADVVPYVRPVGAFLVGEDQTTLSTNSNTFDNSGLKIYPNPVASSFKISKVFTDAVLYSITGKKLLKFSGDNEHFNVSKLNTGIYLLRINDNKGNSEFIKLIKE